MPQITNRERLLRLFRGAPLDRIPVSPRIASAFTREWFDDPDVDIVAGACEIYRHFGWEIIDWNCTPHFELFDFGGPDPTRPGSFRALQGPGWKPAVRYETSGSTTHEIVTVTTPGGQLRRVLSTCRLSRFEQECGLTEYAIKTERDFNLICQYMPPVPPLDCGELIRSRALLGDDGVLSPSFHGPFNLLVYCYRKLDDLMLDCRLNPDFFHAMMEFFLQRIMKYLQPMIDTGTVDMFDMGMNVANSKLVSPKDWAELFLPYENRLADFVQQRGVLPMMHQCGHAANHLKVYHKLHHKMWGYLAPPPHGDTILAEAVRILPKELILWGGVDQIDFLRQATPREIDARVQEVIQTVKSRGNFILGTTDYLETHTPRENLQAFADAGRKYGAYD
jgi:uroporphyrinogen-III decarboxylase